MSLQLIINGFSLGAVYSLIAVGFAIVFSVLKFSNFAHGGMISVCAYIGFFFQRAFNPAPPIYITVVFTAFCGMAVALLIDQLAYRRIRKNNSPRVYYFLASLTFSIIIEQILNVTYSKNQYAYPNIFKSTTFHIGSLRFSSMDTMIMVVSLIILVILIIFITKTKIGLAIRAVAINPDTSRLMGINSNIIILTVFIIAGALAGITGVFLGAKYSVYPEVGPLIMLKGFIASIIGGLGSLSGAIIAAIALGMFEMILTYYIGAFSTPVVLFAVMLGFLFIRPQGIAGKFTQDKA
jgi:branched-chain amino acid transport system permease protein